MDDGSDTTKDGDDTNSQVDDSTEEEKKLMLVLTMFPEKGGAPLLTRYRKFPL